MTVPVFSQRALSHRRVQFPVALTVPSLVPGLFPVQVQQNQRCSRCSRSQSPAHVMQFASPPSLYSCQTNREQWEHWDWCFHSITSGVPG